MAWSVYKASRWPPRVYRGPTLIKAKLPTPALHLQLAKMKLLALWLGEFNAVGFKPIWAPWPGQEGAALAYDDPEEHRTEPPEAW